MKYTTTQVAKFITAAVTGISTIGVSIATALTDGNITPDEWAIIIPIISGAVLTAAGVFFVPNGLAGDGNVEEKK